VLLGLRDLPADQGRGKRKVRTVFGRVEVGNPRIMNCRSAQSRNPMDMMRHGCSMSLFHASQQ